MRMQYINLNKECASLCEICGKRRGRVGNKNMRHEKCSVIRKARYEAAKASK